MIQKQNELSNEPENKDQLTPLEAIHKAAYDLYAVGMLSKEKMRKFDKICSISSSDR